MKVEKMLELFEDCIDESDLYYYFKKLSKDEKIEFVDESVKILKVYFER